MEGIQRVQMRVEHMETMRAHIMSCLPNEACGILGGIEESVQEVIPVTNALKSPTRFRMEPTEQLAALQRIEDMGYQMIGIYHSHISGPATPSTIDLDESYYPNVAYLVWSPSRTEWNCRSFRIMDRIAIEIPMVLYS